MEIGWTDVGYILVSNTSCMEHCFDGNALHTIKPAHKYLYNAGKLTCLNGSLTHKKSV